MEPSPDNNQHIEAVVLINEYNTTLVPYATLLTWIGPLRLLEGAEGIALLYAGTAENLRKWIELQQEVYVKFESDLEFNRFYWEH